MPRPCIAFHARVLNSFLSGVPYDPVAFPSLSFPGVVWAAAPFTSPCFSDEGVAGILGYFFCSPGESLAAVPCGDCVFSVQVASVAVAQFLLAAGPGLMFAINLSLHATWREARAWVPRTRARLTRGAFNPNGAGRRLMRIIRPIPLSPHYPHLLPLPGTQSEVSPAHSPSGPPSLAAPIHSPATPRLVRRLAGCKETDDGHADPDVAAAPGTPSVGAGINPPNEGTNPYLAALLSPQPKTLTLLPSATSPPLPPRLLSLPVHPPLC